MRDSPNWLATNDHYLAEALTWLRERLEGMAELDDAGTASAPAHAPAAPRGFIARLRTGAAPDIVAKPDPKPAPTRNTAPGWDAAHPPAIIELARHLGLSDFEREVLLLAVAMELDTRVGALCARAQRDHGKPYPTFALAFTLFDNAAWDAMSPERPLRAWQLLELDPNSQVLTAGALRADERIVNYVKGLDYLDARIAPQLTPIERPGGDAILPPSQARVAAMLERTLAAMDGAELPVLELLGIDSPSKAMVAHHVASARQLKLYRLPADALPAAVSDADRLALLWRRETFLTPLALYIDASEIDRADARADAVRRLAQRAGGLVFLDLREAWPGFERGTIACDIAKPTPAEQRDAWQAALGFDAGEQPARLAGQFNFNLAAIRAIATRALADGGGKLADVLREQCLMHARPVLDQLAQRLEPKATWGDLKLPAQEEGLLRQVVAQVGWRDAVYEGFGFRARMNRGLGISVLFAGESGTGKTMAAEVIANELALLLYRIDLSAVVSKYIGETEKNLRKLFDAAEDGGAILFFDEADALFGKRSEVRDSHDRYANIEVNYLLQRIESYQGLAILATNMKTALDAAFMRRLRFVVNFPYPGAAQRKAMWQQAFPAKTPCISLDYERLARLNLCGGNIQSVALNSAFMAASSGSPVTMPILLDCARAEFRKLDKPINENDFRWQGGEGTA